MALDITEPPPAEKRITELWAWVVIHPDGGEGVPALTMEIAGRTHLLPMMGADLERISSLEMHARSIAAAKGYPIELRRFAGAAPNDDQHQIGMDGRQLATVMAGLAALRVTLRLRPQAAEGMNANAQATGVPAPFTDDAEIEKVALAISAQVKV